MLRPCRTPLGVAVALALTAVFSLTAIEAVGLLIGKPPGLLPLERIGAALWATRWSDASAAGAGVIAALAGTVMIMAALLPGRTRLVPLRGTDPHTVTGVTRRGLRRSLRAVAQSVDGVERARVRLGHRHIEVMVVVAADCGGHMLRKVGTAVGDRLAGVGALSGGEVVVRLRGKRR
ncbi:hypothetical protein SAMN05421505_105158 [Sinosporangium album]|uniref:DUF6286 domain-containing protein n=1 Tax=Sinosporangium album TaxID=504805 RepID=A0A1G7V7Z8_9ACTN|nr:hypothetical protein SAMN05421505_105158 [Sinosporangium album]